MFKPYSIVFKGNPWIAADRRYLEPEEVGLQLINFKNYGDALILAWVIRDTDGIWSTILGTERYESVYKESNTIHDMHWPLLHITDAFKNFYIKPGTHKNYNTHLLNT